MNRKFRSKKQYFLVILLLLFLPMTLALIVMPYLIEDREISIAASIFSNIFGGFFTVVIVFSFFHYQISYAFQNANFILSSALKKKKYFHIKEIKEFRRLSDEEAYNFWNEFYVKQLNAKMMFDFFSLIKEGRKVKEIVTYCSLSPRYSETKIGGTQVISYAIQVNGNFFWLELNDGRKFLLTPQKADEFEKQIHLFLRKDENEMDMSYQFKES